LFIVVEFPREWFGIEGLKIVHVKSANADKRERKNAQRHAVGRTPARLLQVKQAGGNSFSGQTLTTVRRGGTALQVRKSIAQYFQSSKNFSIFSISLPIMIPKNSIYNLYPSFYIIQQLATLAAWVGI